MRVGRADLLRDSPARGAAVPALSQLLQRLLLLGHREVRRVRRQARLMQPPQPDAQNMGHVLQHAHRRCDKDVAYTIHQRASRQTVSAKALRCGKGWFLRACRLKAAAGSARR